jgi:hypothetical protein
MTIRRELIDELLKEYPNPQDVLAEDGLLKQLTKAVIERCLETEQTEMSSKGIIISRPNYGARWRISGNCTWAGLMEGRSSPRRSRLKHRSRCQIVRCLWKKGRRKAGGNRYLRTFLCFDACGILELFTQDGFRGGNTRRCQPCSHQSRSFVRMPMRMNLGCASSKPT